MPRILVLEKLPLEYLTVGEVYEVYIGQSDVTYTSTRGDGASTFGRRSHYKEYIEKGQIILLYPSRRGNEQAP